jgi:oligoribonuclease NrnB/cAMP/cGMP phosphodiesterase (DHH superfamily)
MKQLDNEKLIALMNIYNELTKRVGDYYTKEAQYKEHASSLADQIVNDLREANLINEEQSNKLKENLLKSATAALTTLSEVAKNVANSNINSLGTPYSVAGDRFSGKNVFSSRYVEFDGLTLDKTRYL